MFHNDVLCDDILQIFKTAPEFADVANTRVLNSSKMAAVQKPPSLSSSQTSSTSSSLQSSIGAGVPASAAGARSVHQSSYAQSYLIAAGANQSNNNPVGRSAALSRSAAGPLVYANVPVCAEPVVTRPGRARMQPAGMPLLAYILLLLQEQLWLIITAVVVHCSGGGHCGPYLTVLCHDLRFVFCFCLFFFYMHYAVHCVLNLL